MYNVKSFVDLVDVESSVFISGESFGNTVQTEEPCVLISAKDLYRMIHGRSQSLKDKITTFIGVLNHDVQTLSDYDNKLRKEIKSIQVDIYCKNELEDAAFMTGDYKQPVPVAHKTCSSCS